MSTVVKFKFKKFFLKVRVGSGISRHTHTRVKAFNLDWILNGLLASEATIFRIQCINQAWKIIAMTKKRSLFYLERFEFLSDK